jgi:hypothetical protein
MWASRSYQNNSGDQEHNIDGPERFPAHLLIAHLLAHCPNIQQE